MDQTRRDGWLLMLLGSAVLLVLGFTLRGISPQSMIDFKVPYYGAQCLFRGGDPYNQADVLRSYDADKSVRNADPSQNPLDAARVRMNATRFVYLPPIFSIVAPLALLPFGWASLIWTLLLAGGLTAAAFLIWEIAAQWAPLAAGALLAFLLANAVLPLMIGNPAGIAVSLCVVAMWCFWSNRYAWAGVLCLASSLMLKPHDVFLVWLFLLLAGSVFRKRALQVLLVVLLLSLPSLIWVQHVSPHWFVELHDTLTKTAMRGGPDDPGPSSSGGHTIGMMVNLQTAVSFFRDDPRYYNTATYLLCGGLIAAWAIATYRSRPDKGRIWIALAPISALTLLPIYHRQCDAVLLLLAIPACCMLWARRGRVSKMALLVTAIGLFWTADWPWVVVLSTISRLHFADTPMERQIVAAIQMFPAPISLLAVGVFYLWIYLSRPAETVRHKGVI